MRQKGPKTLLSGSFFAENRPSFRISIPWIGRSIPCFFRNTPWIAPRVGGANAAMADNERFMPLQPPRGLVRRSLLLASAAPSPSPCAFGPRGRPSVSGLAAEVAVQPRRGAPGGGGGGRRTVPAAGVHPQGPAPAFRGVNF